MTPAELEQFAQKIAAMVVERLQVQPKLVDRYGLAKILGVSVPTIERMQRDDRIPIVRIGTRVLYDPSAVVAALSAALRRHCIGPGGSDE